MNVFFSIYSSLRLSEYMASQTKDKNNDMPRVKKMDALCKNALLRVHF